MPPSSSSDQGSSIHVFRNKLESLNTSTDTYSFRVYYAVALASIPFTWESRPGTPKRDSLPEPRINLPLTPPPSYKFHTNNATANTVSFKNKSKNKLAVLSKNSTSFFSTLLKKKPHPPLKEERKKVGLLKSSLCFWRIKSS